MINMKKIIFKIIIILSFIAIFEICMPAMYSNAGSTTTVHEIIDGGGGGSTSSSSSESKSVTEYAEGMTGNVSTKIDTSQLQTIIGRVVGAIQVIAGLFAVLTIALTGFEYILCQTPHMKDELKNRMLPIIIALVLIFGAVSIAQFLMAAFE